jgi:hypothetical protein
MTVIETINGPQASARWNRDDQEDEGCSCEWDLSLSPTRKFLAVINTSLRPVKRTLYTMLQPNLSTRKPPSAAPSLKKISYRQNEIM